jgi:hypothetical protein
MHQVQSAAQSAVVFFADVEPKTAFYPGVNGGSHYGKCIKLFRPIRVKHGSLPLPFLATAVSEEGILLEVEEDGVISFSSPLPSAEAEMAEPRADRNQMEISVIEGYFFAEGLQKSQPVRAYIRTTGQLV